MRWVWIGTFMAVLVWSGIGPKEHGIDVRQLLRATLGRSRPRSDMQERVRGRLAAMETAGEWVLLALAAPVSGLSHSFDQLTEAQEEEEKADADAGR